MLVKENAENISHLVDKLFEFVTSDDDIQTELRTYLDSYPEKITSPAQMQSVLLPFVFDEKLSNSRKVTDIYIEKNSSLSNEELEVLNGLSKSMLSIFEIKKILKNGFELYNIVNEKMYTCLSLVKMVHFRGVTTGQFLIGRIFPYKEDYYLVEIDNIINERNSEQAYRHAVMMQLEKPELLYLDNEEKLAEIQTTIDDMAVKFNDFFGKTEIITTTEYVDELLGYFNDYVEDPDLGQDINFDDYIKLPEKFAYFDVKDANSENMDIIEAAAKGFAVHEKVYDVGIIFDEIIGLSVLPFYGTFKEIFKTEDYKSIEGYDECILNYFTSDKIPPLPIIKAYEENPDKFIKIVNDVLKPEGQVSIDSLLHKYKSDYYENRKFSSAIVLYSSKVFSILMENTAKEEISHSQVDRTIGRNVPCPCGSGKKYKKCCMLKG